MKFFILCLFMVSIVFILIIKDSHLYDSNSVQDNPQKNTNSSQMVFEEEILKQNPDNSSSPATFSSIDSKSLNANQQKGQKIYSRWCLPCHGVGMPATNALEVVYKDSDTPALLEKRVDFTPEVIAIFVRNGQHSMPFFRKTEINDEELQYLGEYLSRNTQ